MICNALEMGLAADCGRVDLHSRTGSTSRPLSVAKSAFFLRNGLYARVTSTFGTRPAFSFRFGRFKAEVNKIMAESSKFTHCLLELPKFIVNDV